MIKGDDSIKKDIFTYEKPNEEIFFKGLIAYLKSNDKEEIVDLIKYAKCKIKTTNKFSRIRWNAHAAEVYFYLSINDLESIKVKGRLKSSLKIYCSKILPDYYGYDIVAVEFLLLMNDSKGLIEDLDDIIRSLSMEIKNEILPKDIKKKCNEMAEVYIYLYYVENFLRLFIDKIAESRFGIDYFDKLNINTDIKNMIGSRKQNEAKNKWLGVRGDSDLFYLDFEDLNKIIVNNWNIFKPYFPDQNWITTKIKEMANCRNLVAHNSFIDDHGINVIKTDYISILRQIGGVLS